MLGHPPVYLPIISVPLDLSQETMPNVDSELLIFFLLLKLDA